MTKALHLKMGCKPDHGRHVRPMLGFYSWREQYKYPERADFAEKIVPVRMFKNNEAGDCPVATIGHHIQAMSAAVAGAPADIPDESIIDAYCDITAGEGARYDPATGENDNGTVPSDALEYWRGHGIAGHRCTGWVGLSPQNTAEVRYACATFCGFQASLALPLSAAEQYDRHEPWTCGPSWQLKNRPGSWGYHRVWIGAYDKFSLYAATWDRIQPIDLRWFLRYCVDADAVVSRDFVNGAGIAPTGISWEELLKDLSALGPVA